MHLKDKNNKAGFQNSDRKHTNEKTGIIVEEINTLLPYIQNNTSVSKIMDWNLNTLIDYLKDTHRSIRENAIRIYKLAQDVAYCDGGTHPELNEFNSAMFSFMHDLLNHMMREEQILFPNITQLSKDNKSSTSGKFSTFGLIKEWSSHMQTEHLLSCRSLMALRQMCNNYSIPTDASDSHKALFSLMQEFEAGCLLLMDFENNILFPKALIEDGDSV